MTHFQTRLGVTITYLKGKLILVQNDSTYICIVCGRGAKSYSSTDLINDFLSLSVMPCYTLCVCEGVTFFGGEGVINVKSRHLVSGIENSYSSWRRHYFLGGLILRRKHFCRKNVFIPQLLSAYSLTGLSKSLNYKFWTWHNLFKIKQSSKENMLQRSINVYSLVGD